MSKSKTVVVIEDDVNTLDLISLSLQQVGIKVFPAQDGLSGLELIRKHHPDGILLDIKLPRMNGYEVCTTLQTDKDLSNIPIMMMTALTEDGGTEDSKWRDRLCVADFISKPFSPTEFVERVQKMLAM